MPRTIASLRAALFVVTAGIPLACASSPDVSACAIPPASYALQYASDAATCAAGTETLSFGADGGATCPVTVEPGGQCRQVCTLTRPGETRTVTVTYTLTPDGYAGTAVDTIYGVDGGLVSSCTYGLTATRT